MITRKGMRISMLAVVLCGCAQRLIAVGRERIISFDSDIIVHEDATMTVKETITVESQGFDIKRGIKREFPTRYMHNGLSYRVGFDVVEVMRDGVKTPYDMEDFANGKRLYIRKKDYLLPPGIYTFTIIYNTYRQLGFFKDHDELYWNVTGNGWPWVIEHAKARVVLPPSIARDSIKVSAFTGPQGEHGAAYTAVINADGTIDFATTQRLYARQGLTIAVSWPKGYVTQPLLWQEIVWYMRDNGLEVILFMGLILVLLFYLSAWWRARRAKKPGTIIPLFEPPAGMAPAAVALMNKIGYSEKAFAAQIVHLAVQGLLKISYEKNKYTLINQQDLSDLAKNKSIAENDIQLMKRLFAQGDSLVIAASNRFVVSMAQKFLRNYLDRIVASPYISYNRGTIIAGAALFIVILLIGLTIFPTGYSSIWYYFLLFAFGLLQVLFAYLLPTYTPEGRKVQDGIDGFKLFLVTTETERLKLIGTPPTKNPELYEKYLPYAMALGVEKQWSRQFTPIFKRLEQEGHPYVPLWYIGPGPFHFSSFGSNLSSSFSSSIASSVTAPGKSSGFGGGGSSGGGGGGGGGGGC